MRSQVALGIAAIPFASLLYGMTIGKYNFKVIKQTLFFPDLPDDFDIGYHVGNVGSGSTISIISSKCSNSSTYDLFVEHPNANGIFQSIFTNDKISIDPSASISLTNQDPIDSSYSIVGDFQMGSTIDTLTDVTDLVVYGTSYGLYSGGTISANTGLTFNVSAGYGYLEDTITNYVKYVEWSGVTGVVTPTNSTQYVYVNDSGVVNAVI